jgi:flagellar hook-associated protein 3 FlgL
MRISSNTIFENGVSNMLARQQELVKTQGHISTGRRILSPADDPVAAAQVLDVSEAKDINKHYAESAQTVKTRLGLQEQALAAMTRLMQDVKRLTVQAGDGALSPGDLRGIAEDVNGRYQELLGLANSTDGSGEYLFAGFRTQIRPFAEVTPGVVAYLGDDGKREVPVSASRSIAVNDPGSDILQRIKNGNGTFVTSAASGNAGTGIVSPGSVIDAALLTNHNYMISFTVAAGVTTYSIVDTTSATTIASNVTYTPDGPIAFDGMQLAISGDPANGDTFSVDPSANVSVFATLDILRQALLSAGTGAVANAQLTNALNTVHSNLQNSIDKVLSIHASVGTRLRETESIVFANEDLDLAFQTRLSELSDLDYARALSDLNFQQLHLEAAQKSFVRISELSLFSLL